MCPCSSFMTCDIRTSHCPIFDFVRFVSFFLHTPKSQYAKKRFPFIGFCCVGPWLRDLFERTQNSKGKPAIRKRHSKLRALSKPLKKQYFFNVNSRPRKCPAAVKTMKGARFTDFFLVSSMEMGSGDK